MITLKNATKSYDNGRDVGMADVSLTIHDGEFLCIVGPSGCGKSTLLKVLSRLEELTAGEMKKETAGISDRVAMVFQNGALFPWLTVQENIAIGLEASGVSHTHALARSGKYIELMNLQEHAHKYGRDLSGGQRQRVGIARALAAETDILLLDEPFSALDPKTTFELHKDLLDIWNKTGKTIVMVSHSIEEAVTLSQRIVLMKSGTVERIIPVPLPYPRLDTSIPFIHLVHEIRDLFFK